MARTTGLSPHTLKSGSATEAVGRALALFHDAATRVPAYADFLRQNNIRPQSITTKEAFEDLPTVSKENYFSQYTPDELSWDGRFSNSRFISTSSGSSGTPFIWPRGAIHENISAPMFQRIYEDIYGTDKGTTLFIISFAFGQWIAGFEFYNAVCFAQEKGNRISLVTSGIELADVVAKVKEFSNMFDRVVIAGYPPFLKDIVETGIRRGIDWKAIDIYFNAAGEPYSEKWRDVMLKLIGREKEVYRLINVYGMSEAGIVAHETPNSIKLRRFLMRQKEARMDRATCLYQYNPSLRYFEAIDDGSLLLTTNADFPLIRYETRDLGGIITDAQDFHKEAKINTEKWRLPYLYLYGRKDFSVLFYALNVYTENIKMGLEEAGLSKTLSGLFTMNVDSTSQQNQRLVIEIELNKGELPSKELEKKIRDAIVKGLTAYNTEYAKLHQMIGQRALPRVVLFPFGELKTIRGKKHTWVKKD